MLDVTHEEWLRRAKSLDPSGAHHIDGADEGGGGAVFASHPVTARCSPRWPTGAPQRWTRPWPPPTGRSTPAHGRASRPPSGDGCSCASPSCSKSGGRRSCSPSAWRWASPSPTRTRSGFARSSTPSAGTASWPYQLTDESPHTAPDALALREPAGVVGAVVPWHFPLTLAGWKAAPALAAGCTVVLTPSENSPLSAVLLERIAIEAGLPPGVLNVVNGDGPTAGQALGLHADVDVLAFTRPTRHPGAGRWRR